MQFPSNHKATVREQPLILLSFLIEFKSSNGSDNNGGSTDWGSSANESTDWGASGSSSDNKGETADWGTSAGNSSAKNEANTSDWGATTTTDWGASGDSASDGAKNSRGSSKGCFKCGEEGHMSRECPKGGGGGNRGKGCFKCGEEGHMSRDCTKEGENGDSRVREKYTPPTLDETDESIVMSTIAPGSNFHKSMLAGKCKVTPEEWGDKHFMSFEEALKSETLLTALQKGSITEPTPIQKYAMKVIMEGHDMMACSYTGSGKTLAYVLPILQYLFDERELPNGYGQECQEPVALTICPTRELAKQVYEVFFKFTRGTILKPQILYGGTSVTHQKGQLSAGCHILVGTPGRIRHFLKDGLIALSKLKYLVLDEADRMIDDGFIPDVRQMMVHPTTTKKEDRQTLMFSATYPAKVQQVAGEFLRKGYYFVSTGTGDKIGGANEDIDQQILLVEKSQKRPKLVEILGTTDIKDRTMVFVDAKKTADFLASYLSQSGYKSTSMHGDRYQRQREQALNDLKSGKFPILVATNVAARGLDVSDIRHVINYDLPSEIDEYVHRIGRTGRVGNIGKATSFYDPNSNDKRLAADLLDVLKDANKTIPDWLKEEAEGGQSKFGSDDYGKTDIRTVSIKDWLILKCKPLIITYLVIFRQLITPI